ncbi:unnamed protein product, partial [marine sediment metagenome]
MFILCLIITILLIFIFILIIHKLFYNSNTLNNINNKDYLVKIHDNLENDNQNSLDLFNNYPSYRLGDAVYLLHNKNNWNYNPNHSTLKYANISLHNYEDIYPNSILSEYLKLSNYTEKNWDSLIEIVNNKFISDIN